MRDSQIFSRAVQRCLQAGACNCRELGAGQRNTWLVLDESPGWKWICSEAEWGYFANRPNPVLQLAQDIADMDSTIRRGALKAETDLIDELDRKMREALGSPLTLPPDIAIALLVIDGQWIKLGNKVLHTKSLEKDWVGESSEPQPVDQNPMQQKLLQAAR